MSQPIFFHSANSDLLPLTQIPLRYRKSVLAWLDARILDRNESLAIPQGLYEFWLDNLSDHAYNEQVLDF